MKQKIKLLGVLAGLLGIVFACEKGESLVSAQNGNSNVSPVVKSAILANAPKQSILSNSTSKGDVDSSVTWNYDSMREVTAEGFKGNVVMVDANGYNVNNRVNYGLAYYLNPQDPKEIFLELIIKTDKVSDSTTEITYYDEDGTKVLVVKSDDKTETNTVVYKGTSTARGRRCSGSVTFDCIQDAYSHNHGWVSVWLWSQSIIFPETCGVIAIACAYSC